MQRYAEIFLTSFGDYARYVWTELTSPSWHSYLYWLIGISALVYALELVRPWRKEQPKVREDFWLDAFYMFFNFFLFSLAGYHAFASVVEAAFVDLRMWVGIGQASVVDVESWPVWAQLLVMLVLRDFIHYWIHRLLHRVPVFWRFHQIHHSVQQMGFAAHLRFHPLETVVYRTLEYIPLGLIGFGLQDFFVVHIFTLTIGHLNHANVHIPLGPFRYLFNSASMHIWHHAKDVPKPCNFGLTFSLWDYLFGTVHWPGEGRDEPLGFDDVESYPEGFATQMVAGVVSPDRAEQSS